MDAVPDETVIVGRSVSVGDPARQDSELRRSPADRSHPMQGAHLSGAGLCVWRLVFRSWTVSADRHEAIVVIATQTDPSPTASASQRSAR